jgi:plastocyanin
MKPAVAAVLVLAAATVALGAATSDAGIERAHGVPPFAPLFADNPLTGGQVAPRAYRWVNDRTSIFVQFDRPQQPRALRYVGISVKGTFCSETQPGGESGGFTHFHRLDAPSYAVGHGGPPGTQGYWLLWGAVDDFAAFDGREIRPGVDYGFSPTPPPACNGSPSPTFGGPGAHRLSRAEIGQLAAQFPDNPLRGGQTAPRYYRWVTGDTLVFLEFDRADLTKATALRYIGVAKRGTFCKNDQPSADFASFQRLRAESYAKGRGGKAGEAGFWHMALAVDDMTMPWGRVTPGVDRKYLATAAPACGGGGSAAAEVRTVAVAGNADAPFAFQPAEVTVRAGQAVRFVNGDGAFHTVTSTDSLARRVANGLFNGTLATRDATFQQTFARPGTFAFFCQPHSAFMTGTVRVTE